MTSVEMAYDVTCGQYPARLARYGKPEGPGDSSGAFAMAPAREYVLRIVDFCDVRSGHEDVSDYLRMRERLAGNRGAVQLKDFEIVTRDGETRLFLVEEWCAPLAESLPSQALTLTQAVEIIIDVTYALEALWKADVFHAGFGPRSIFYARDGRLRIGDLRFARVLEEGDVIIPDDQRLLCLAPEIARGEEPTEASFVYAAAALLCRLLTAWGTKDGFDEAADIQDMLGALSVNVTDVPTDRATHARALFNVLRLSCYTDPKRRLATLSAFRVSLAPIVDGTKVASVLFSSEPSFASSLAPVVIEDTLDIVPPELARKYRVRSRLEKEFDSLTDHERKVIIFRFGLEDGNPHTLEEVGHKFGITSVRVRQIESKIFVNRQHPTPTKKLKDYIADDLPITETSHPEQDSDDDVSQ